MPLRSFYFLFYAAGAVLMPSLALLFEDRGFGGAEVGLLTAAIPLTVAVVAPLWGAAADRSGRGTRLLVVATLLSAASAPVMVNLGVLPLALVAVIVFAVGFAPVLPFVDAATLDHSVRVGGSFGSIRQWGGVGWGLAAPAIGLVVGRVGTTATWVAYSALMVALAVVARGVRVPGGTYEGRSREAVGTLLRLPGWRPFLATAALFGVGTAIQATYLFVRLDDLGASATTMGLALTLGTVSELVAFNVADRTLRRFGTMPVLLLGVGAMAVRLAVVALAPAPGVVLAVQLTHGLTFALPYTAAVSFVAHRAPVALRASGQALFGLAFGGLAPAIGSLAGGVVLGRAGSAATFGWAAVAVAVAVVALAVAWARGPRIGGAQAPDAASVGRAVTTAP